MLTREEAQALTARVLKMSAADATRVTIVSSRGGNTRFADASITTSGGIEDTSVTVTATVGRRRASASTNVLDDASLQRTVDLAARLARLCAGGSRADAGARAADLRQRDRVRRPHRRPRSRDARRGGAPIGGSRQRRRQAGRARSSAPGSWTPTPA